MSKEQKLMTQVSLREVPNGTKTDQAIMTTWVDKPVRAGTKITLKKDDRLWLVEQVYNTVPIDEINDQKWDNNI